MADTSSVIEAATLPEPLSVRRVAFRVPQESEVSDPKVLASLRRGRAILRNTRDSLPRNVGNRLSCTSCHQKDGTVRSSMPWVGVYARFPQYRSRAGYTQVIEDRINDCLRRSMNGKPLANESRAMRDIVAYMAFLSLGYPVGAEVDGQGLAKLDPVAGDAGRGRTILVQRCAKCHGQSGQGGEKGPPLWGKDSYNIGAGMARVRTAAAFIHGAMPQDAPGTLSVQQAFDLATYINSRPRPDFPGKELDWPNGDPPPDVAYATRAKKRAR